MLLANRAGPRCPSRTAPPGPDPGGALPAPWEGGFAFASGRRVSLMLSPLPRPRPREGGGRSTWNIDPTARGRSQAGSGSAASPAVPPDRLVDVVAVLDPIGL